MPDYEAVEVTVGHAQSGGKDPNLRPDLALGKVVMAASTEAKLRTTIEQGLQLSPVNEVVVEPVVAVK